MDSPADERRPLLANIVSQQPELPSYSTNETTAVAGYETSSDRQVPAFANGDIGPLCVSLLVDSVPGMFDIFIILISRIYTQYFINGQ
jgi:hypothetical protein